MNDRLRRLALAIGITTAIITIVVTLSSILAGRESLYEIGEALLTVGITSAVVAFTLFYRSHHRTRTRINLHLSIEERNRFVPDPYYDYFAGAVLGTVVVAFLALGFMFTAGTWGDQKGFDATIPNVGSVRAEYLNIKNNQLQWRDDAYLTELDYDFGEQPLYILSASFQSPSDPNKLMVVDVTSDGEYVQEEYRLSLSLPPILDTDWPIDSQEAINIFAYDEDVRTCLAYPNDREKRLTLGTRDGQVRWCLRIEECAVLERRICIDASSGKVIPMDQ